VDVAYRTGVLDIFGFEMFQVNRCEQLHVHRHARARAHTLHTHVARRHAHTAHTRAHEHAGSSSCASTMPMRSCSSNSTPSSSSTSRQRCRTLYSVLSEHGPAVLCRLLRVRAAPVGWTVRHRIEMGTCKTGKQTNKQTNKQTRIRSVDVNAELS
jgi:hypothetical protein